MKNKKQIQELAKKITPVDEINKLAILGYCSQRKIKFKFGGNHNDNLYITFEEFKKIVEEDAPEKNDVICFNKTYAIGIVKSVGVKNMTLGVRFQKGRLLTREAEIPIGEFHKATYQQVILLQNKLCQKNLSWNKLRGCLNERLEPYHNQHIRITLLGEKLGVGIFREISDKKQAIFYCIKMQDQPIRYSLYENIGNICDFQLEKAHVLDRHFLSEKLKEAGKVWNGHSGRIEPLNLQVSIGRNYFYIDCFFYIRTSTDTRRPRDKNRLRRGNYFQYKEEAEDLVYLFGLFSCNFNLIRGEKYYYIDENWKIRTSIIDKSPSNVKRQERGNCYGDKAYAENIISVVNDRRKKQLSE